MRNSLTLKFLIFMILEKQNGRTFHPLTGTIFVHKMFKKCFPSEDSSVLFSQGKCATIHLSRHRQQLSRRFNFQTFYIVQQLCSEINSLCKGWGCLRPFFFFKLLKLLDLSVPQKNVINKDKQDISRTPRLHLPGVPLTNQQLLIEKWNWIQLSSSAVSHAEL